MRESIKFLKENEKGWQQRRIGEVDRIKEEEKMERLAICKQKRKRYGIRKLNKEEQKRIRERTSERIEIAQAKANYWKLHRGGGVATKNAKEWERVRESIILLEEKGRWRRDEEDIGEDKPVESSQDTATGVRDEQ